VGIGLANAVPVLFSKASQIKGVAPSIGVAMVATLGYGGLLLGPPLIGFGADLVGLRGMLGLLILFAAMVIALSGRALESRALEPRTV
jgi:MFS family permease